MSFWKPLSALISKDGSGEIGDLTEKASPVDADLVLVEDSEASNVYKYAQLGNLPGGGGGGGSGTPSKVYGSMYLTSDLTSDENPIVWDATGDDEGGAVNLANNRFDAQTSGLKILTLRHAWTGTLPDDMYVHVKVNGSDTGVNLLSRFTEDSETSRQHITSVAVWADVGDEITVRTNAGTQVSMRGTATRSLTTELWYFEVGGFPILGDGTELTIATGAVTVTQGFHTVDTESDAATDDLATINGGSTGQMLVLKSADAGRDPTLKDGTGNLALAGDFTLSDPDDTITLIYDGTNWCEASRSDNAT